MLQPKLTAHATAHAYLTNARRNPDERITPRAALQHPWLAGGTAADRQAGPPIQRTVVQRLQVSASTELLHALCVLHEVPLVMSEGVLYCTS